MFTPSSRNPTAGCCLARTRTSTLSDTIRTGGWLTRIWRVLLRRSTTFLLDSTVEFSFSRAWLRATNPSPIALNAPLGVDP